jgi:hypothetical protein
VISVGFLVFLPFVAAPALLSAARFRGGLLLLAGALVVGIVWTILDPARGLQDRLAGTYLVPR